MAQVRIQAVLGTGFSSRAISWFGGEGQFSHIDSILSNGTLLGARSDIITPPKGEPIPAGVQIRPPFYETWRKRQIFTFQCGQPQANKWEKFLRAQLYAKYDKSLIFGFAIGDTRDWRETDTWICSELAIRALEIAEIIPQLYVPARSISPNAAVIAITAAGAKWTA